MADASKSEWTAGHPVNGIASLKIADEIGRLKRGAQWVAGDRVAESLAKNSELSVTLLLLKPGAILKEHRARGTVVLTTVTGSIRLNGATLPAGTVAVIDREAPHAVEAIEESALLLTAVLK
jgi:quercetin dioxygenase-like cupin family protein